MLNFYRSTGFRLDPFLQPPTFELDPILGRDNIRHKKTPLFLTEFFVGDEGFEPPTPSV